MAFGLSGEDSRIAMIEADIVVVDYKEDRDPRAIDYYISDYAQVCYYKFVFEWWLLGIPIEHVDCALVLRDIAIYRIDAIFYAGNKYIALHTFLTYWQIAL